MGRRWLPEPEMAPASDPEAPTTGYETIGADTRDVVAGCKTIVMRLYRDRAVVLRQHKLGEADRIVTLLTRDHGLVRAVAKGVRRTRSKFGARLEPFAHIEVQLHPGRNLDIVTQVVSVSAGERPLAQFTSIRLADDHRSGRLEAPDDLTVVGSRRDIALGAEGGWISTWPLPEAFNGVTVNGVLARTVEDAALVLDAASGNVEGDRHQPPPVTVSDFVGIAPGPLKIALSTHFPYTGFRAKLHPEILAATQRVGDQLELLGHTVVKGNPDYGLRLSWNFLARSTAGLWEWAERLGDEVTLDRRTVSNLRMGHVLSQAILRSARRHEAADQRRVGSIFDIVDVVLAPTTAQPPPMARAFDRLGSFGTDRAIIAACPSTWPWNLLGWPSINVPAGFTSDGLPIGVQLMGPANSEGMLISLAAELEAVSGWATKQPQVWWTS